jgi:hypothetical protein
MQSERNKTHPIPVSIAEKPDIGQGTANADSLYDICMFTEEKEEWVQNLTRRR